jgi:RNA polymerase sigma-70 factor (ECF subfamily)
VGLSWTPLVSDIVDPDWWHGSEREAPEGFWAKRPDSIPKTGIAVIETLDRAGASGTTDEALMRDISRQRHDALTELYGRHAQRLRATIDGVVHEEAETDDILQEILLQIWKEANRYSPTAGKPLGWIVTIARRRAIDRLRRRQAYSRARERYEKGLGEQRFNPRREAYDPFILNDLRHFLQKCMQALPSLQREAVELAFFKGLSHSEIAAATKAPLGTVKTRLELGLQKLTHALRPLRHKV